MSNPNHHLPKYTQDTFNYSPSAAARSGGGQTISYAPSTSANQNSVYSYQSARDLTSFIKEVNGRFFNSQNDTYFLPSDDPEFDRLDKQHVAFVLAFEGLYPIPDVVEALVQQRPDYTPRILDLGCGSGLWALEMARNFPHAEVIGIDLAPVPIEVDTLPPNCRFEIDDVNLGLEHFKDHFDFIQLRLVGPGLYDYRKTMDDVEACLRPGGLVIFMDGEMELYTEDQTSTVPSGTAENPQGSWLKRVFREMRLASILNGSDAIGMEESIDAGLWDHPLIDPETCGGGGLMTPVGDWARSSNLTKSHRLQYCGTLIRQDFKQLTRAFFTMLLKRGVEQTELDEWTAKVDEELTSNRLRTWLRWRMAWGRRREAEGLPAPPLPAFVRFRPDPSTEESRLAKESMASVHRLMLPSQFAPIPEYDTLRIYHTKEEFDAAQSLRYAAFEENPEVDLRVAELNPREESKS